MENEHTTTGEDVRLDQIVDLNTGEPVDGFWHVIDATSGEPMGRAWKSGRLYKGEMSGYEGEFCQTTLDELRDALAETHRDREEGKPCTRETVPGSPLYAEQIFGSPHKRVVERETGKQVGVVKRIGGSWHGELDEVAGSFVRPNVSDMLVAMGTSLTWRREQPTAKPAPLALTDDRGDDVNSILPKDEVASHGNLLVATAEMKVYERGKLGYIGTIREVGGQYEGEIKKGGWESKCRFYSPYMEDILAAMEESLAAGRALRDGQCPRVAEPQPSGRWTAGRMA